MAVPALWHFTCDHGHRGVGKRGVLQPHPHPLLQSLGPMVWLTSDARPNRVDVGLTSTVLHCDRMAFRYRATPPFPVRWSSISTEVPALVRAALERGADPSIWWLSFEPVPAVLA